LARQRTAAERGQGIVAAAAATAVASRGPFFKSFRLGSEEGRGAKMLRNQDPLTWTNRLFKCISGFPNLFSSLLGGAVVMEVVDDE